MSLQANRVCVPFLGTTSVARRAHVSHYIYRNGYRSIQRTQLYNGVVIQWRGTEARARQDKSCDDVSYLQKRKEDRTTLECEREKEKSKTLKHAVMSQLDYNLTRAPVLHG